MSAWHRLSLLVSLFYNRCYIIFCHMVLVESRHFLINDTNINEVNGASISLAVINTLDVST